MAILFDLLNASLSKKSCKTMQSYRFNDVLMYQKFKTGVIWYAQQIYDEK